MSPRYPPAANAAPETSTHRRKTPMPRRILDARLLREGTLRRSGRRTVRRTSLARAPRLVLFWLVRAMEPVYYTTVTQVTFVLREGCDLLMKAFPEHRKIYKNAVDVIPGEELDRRLAGGERLRVKLGIDPTAPDIHLGFAVVLRELRAFQDLGHIAVLVIGDYTARVGDPSGRSRTRPILSPGQIEENTRTYLKQAYIILDRARAKSGVAVPGAGGRNNRAPGGAHGRRNWQAGQ